MQVSPERDDWLAGWELGNQERWGETVTLPNPNPNAKPSKNLIDI
jgi:hypothetical protein